MLTLLVSTEEPVRDGVKEEELNSLRGGGDTNLNCDNQTFYLFSTLTPPKDKVNGYECSCPEEFQGDNCQYRNDDCAEDPCLFGTCFDGSNSYLCVCESGYNGTNCDQNIDDCEKVNKTIIRARGTLTFL